MHYLNRFFISEYFLVTNIYWEKKIIVLKLSKTKLVQKVCLIDLINTIDGRISIDGNKQKETKIVSFLKNLKGLGVVHFNRFKSNILELNKLEKGDTIQWPIDRYSSVYNRAIVSELKNDLKIIRIRLAPISSINIRYDGTIVEENLIEYFKGKSFSKFYYMNDMSTKYTKR